MKKEFYKMGILLLILSYSILYCGEALLRQNFLGIFRWMMEYPLSFFINWMLLWLLLLGACVLCKKPGRGVLIVGCIYMTFCVISFYKFIISGEYLTPADLILAGEAASISKEMNIQLERHVVIGVLLSLISMLAAYRCKPLSLRRKQRMVGGVLFGTLFFTTAIIGAKVCTSHEEVPKEEKSLTINKQYNDNGFMIGFTQEVVDLIIEKPEGYSEDTVKNLLVPYKVDNPNNHFAKPNIIMIMSESLFDLTNLPGISYSENPLAYFQNYGENYVSGSIATEVYGGRTCQTEYEVLTGHSVYFTDPQNIAYMKLVNEHTPSIPKLLQEEGYKTFAVHGYEKAFFSRDEAYKDLGIETFIASEDLIDPTLARDYVSDDALVDKVIELYENNQNEPLFCHVVTMQNHMPYTDIYTANGIHVEGDNLTAEEKSRLTTYANGVKDSDKALHKLITYFEQVEEPTIIVMYGDHLPALDENYALYEKLHYIEGNFDEADCYKLYQTPFIMWNNYNLPAKSMGVIDASYLGSQMLHYIGYDKDPYMNYLVETKKHLKAYGQNFQIDQDGKLKSLETLSKLEQSVLNNLWMIQYNRLALD